MVNICINVPEPVIKRWKRNEKWHTIRALCTVLYCAKCCDVRNYLLFKGMRCMCMEYERWTRHAVAAEYPIGIRIAPELEQFKFNLWYAWWPMTIVCARPSKSSAIDGARLHLYWLFDAKGAIRGMRHMRLVWVAVWRRYCFHEICIASIQWTFWQRLDGFASIQ